jgi:hypothetical protein
VCCSVCAAEEVWVCCSVPSASWVRLCTRKCSVTCAELCLYATSVSVLFCGSSSYYTVVVVYRFYIVAMLRLVKGVALISGDAVYRFYKEESNSTITNKTTYYGEETVTFETAIYSQRNLKKYYNLKRHTICIGGGAAMA